MYQALFIVGTLTSFRSYSLGRISRFSEHERYFHISKQVDDFIRSSVLSVIKSNCDSFYEKDVSRPVIDFAFCVDTGDSPPVCCHQPSYDLHEGKIMKQHIKALEESGLAIYSSSLSMSVVVTTRFVLENVTKKKLPSSLRVVKRKLIQ